MFLADRTIDDQGNVRTIGGAQDARLYYIDLDGNRKKYLLEGEAGISGSNVTSINGLSGDVTLTTSDIENDSGYITSDNIPVSSVNGQVGNVVVNIPVSSVNGQTGDVLLDVHDIKYETVSGLALSSYVYYTVSSVLTGDILYSIPSGLHDTMVKFTTGPSATFTFSTPETMQLNKEFNFEAEKTYVLAVDNHIVFWNELTAELSGTTPGPVGEYVFEITGSNVQAVNGRYKPYIDFGNLMDGTSWYINENEEIQIYFRGPTDAEVKTVDGTTVYYELWNFDQYAYEPWNCTPYAMGAYDTITVTPIV